MNKAQIEMEAYNLFIKKRDLRVDYEAGAGTVAS